MKQLVDVYPYRLFDNQPEFLILKRAPAKIYAGQWRMIGGKVHEQETSWQAGLRELREETGTFPQRYWAVPSVNQFYEPKIDVIHHIPVFAARLDADATISLDQEHTESQWIDSAQITTFISWPEQQRLLRLIHQILTSQSILDDWNIPL